MEKAPPMVKSPSSDRKGNTGLPRIWQRAVSSSAPNATTSPKTISLSKTSGIFYSHTVLGQRHPGQGQVLSNARFYKLKSVSKAHRPVTSQLETSEIGQPLWVPQVSKHLIIVPRLQAWKQAGKSSKSWDFQNQLCKTQHCPCFCNATITKTILYVLYFTLCCIYLFVMADFFSSKKKVKKKKNQSTST